MTQHRQGVPAVLGIDLGTSSVKVVIADLDGDVIGQSDGGYAVSSPRPGWSETDPQEWWSSTTAAVRTAVAQAKADVLAGRLSGPRHGIAAPGGAGAPSGPGRPWADARAPDHLRGDPDPPPRPPGRALVGRAGHRPAGVVRGPSRPRPSPAGHPAQPGYGRPAAVVGEAARARGVRGHPMGAVPQGLAAFPPHRRVPHRTER